MFVKTHQATKGNQEIYKYQKQSKNFKIPNFNNHKILSIIINIPET